MAGSLIQSFAGLSCPAFLIVHSITPEVLPPINVNTLETPKRSGAYYGSSKFGIRTFDVDATILAPKKKDVLFYAEQLAQWLHYDEPQKLILKDKPNQYYMAKVVGSTELEKKARTGKVSFQFVCYDPHSYSVGEKVYNFNPTSTDPIQLINEGNMETAPIIDVTFTKNVTDFAIVSNDKAIYFGEPFDSTVQTPVDLQPKYINDTGSSTVGWSNGTAVDGGKVAGEIISNGYSFFQGVTDGKRDYGTGSAWHGGAIVKSVGAQVQDFICEARIGFNTSAKNQFGRVELYALDINDNMLAKMALKDAHPTMRAPMWDTWVGKVNAGGTSINKSYGAHVGTLNSFINGVIRVERIGKRWTFYISKITDTGVHHTQIFKQFVDWKQQYMQKVAKIQIHIGAYGSNPPVDDMWVGNVMFKEVKNKKDAYANNQFDYAFRKDDKLHIDCSTNKILLNGEVYYNKLYPTSDYPLLDTGVNGLSVSEPVIKDGKITYRERWM